MWVLNLNIYVYNRSSQVETELCYINMKVKGLNNSTAREILSRKLNFCGTSEAKRN